MTAHENNLIRVLRAGDLAQHVLARVIGLKVVVHAEVHGYLLAPVLHALEHFRVFDCDCSGWDGGVLRVVAHCARVGGGHRKRGHTAHQTADCSLPCSLGGSV